MTAGARTVRHVAVIDIGKSSAKVALVELETLAERATRRIPNQLLADGPYPHHDVDRLWQFILESLAALNREAAVDAISVTAHGATAALLDVRGELAMPVLDYEHHGPESVRAAYQAVRSPFSETGTAPLPLGLNLGAQIFWQQRSFPDAFARVTHILTYPQYWTFRLSGVRATEVTSLGCHTDLWNPDKADFSSLVDRMEWRRLLTPVRPASDRLGPILPAVAARTGLAADTPVLCGIHDSNASLLPHLLSRAHPYAVASTGTWVVVMAPGGGTSRLDPGRDTLVNVDAMGRPVPSARFMGGREYAAITAGLAEDWTRADVVRVLEQPLMLLPSVQQGCGPYPDRVARWIGEPSPAEKRVAASFYLALMTATCLDLIRAEGPTIVEGPFAANQLFLSMLSAASDRPVVTGGDTAGTSTGAALLAAGAKPALAGVDPLNLCDDERCRAYARTWASLL